MSDARDLDLRKWIRNIPDFPKPGILFRDVTPLLAEPAPFRQAVEALAEPFREDGIDHVMGIESRGFIFGAAVALSLGAGFVIVRKEGKLPGRTHRATYELEYGSDTVEMHTDAVEAGQRVLIVDDLLATGGTAAASIRLARDAGASVAGCSFLIELEALGGRKRLDVDHIHTVLRY